MHNLFKTLSQLIHNDFEAADGVPKWQELLYRVKIDS
jgi:hypothetical protein